MHLIHRCQQGFTTVTLMGMLMVGGLLVAATFTAGRPDIGVHAEGRRHQAGLRRGGGRAQLLHEPARAGQLVLHQCDNVPSPTPERREPGVERRGRRPAALAEHPGLQRPSTRSSCSPSRRRQRHRAVRAEQPTSMIDPKTGTFRIRATGRERTPAGATDKPQAQHHRDAAAQGFLDFLYFTDFETLDPYAYSDPAPSTRPGRPRTATMYRGQRGGSCTEIRLHLARTASTARSTPTTASPSAARPTFGRDARRRDRAQRAAARAGSRGCGGVEPELQGHGRLPGRAAADAAVELGARGRRLTRATCSRRDQDRAERHDHDVTNNGTTVTKSLPAERRDLRRTAPAATPATRASRTTPAPASWQPGLRQRLGVGHLQQRPDDRRRQRHHRHGRLHASSTSTVLGGLIANNFVRVYHPVNNWNTSGTDCDNNGGPGNIQIDAAILALNHSFIVDNWYCGNPLGTLHVNGAIAQKFRGPVGTPAAAPSRAATQELQLQRHAALPRAAVLPRPDRGRLARRAPERAGRRRASPRRTGSPRSSAASSSGALAAAPWPWPSSV